MDKENKKSDVCLTLGDMVYKTSGNIIFSDSDKGDFYLADSPILKNMDQAIREGLLGNGMQQFFKKFHP